MRTHTPKELIDVLLEQIQYNASIRLILYDRTDIHDDTKMEVIKASRMLDLETTKLINELTHKSKT